MMLSRKELADKKLTDNLLKELNNIVDCRCLIDEPLANHTSLRVGGPAKFYVLPRSRNDL